MTEAQFAIVSDWMANGNINEFVKENPDAERLPLVWLSFEISLFTSRSCTGLDDFYS